MHSPRALIKFYYSTTVLIENFTQIVRIFALSTVPYSTVLGEKLTSQLGRKLHSAGEGSPSRVLPFVDLELAELTS